MAQGKQTSFGYGEVSPEIHFLSSDVSYANSLSRLKNGFVRYQGGVSNRAGSESIYWNPYDYTPVWDSITEKFITPPPLYVPQENIPEAGGPEGIVGFGYWNSVHEMWDILEIGYFSEGLGYRVNFGEVNTFSTIQLPNPKDIRFLVVKDRILITPSAEWGPTSGGNLLYYKVNLSLDMSSRTIETTLQTGMTDGGAVLSSFTVKGFGLPPFLPVSYLLTATTINDEEFILGEHSTTGYNPSTWNPETGSSGSNNVYFPHSDWTNTITPTITLSGDPGSIKYVTLYRASGASGINGSMYTGVGRARFLSTGITFTDNGQSNINLTPPIDGSFMSPSYPGTTLSFVGQINVATYYQQRLIAAYKNNPPPSNQYEKVFETKAGDMMASRLGAPFHLLKPLIINETDAFQFSPPISDGSEVVGFLSMERLIALTEGAAYGYMGGDNGVFTPFTLNPVKISDVGCSKTVEPKTANGRGYYVSPDHTKVMGVLMNVNGQVKVFEASKNANHLIKNGIRKMELITGQEDILVLLRRDGVLVTVTVNIEGTDTDDDRTGFSTFEVKDGYVESIFKSRTRRRFVPNQKNSEQVDLYQDSLFMYVVRNGNRYLEVLNYRNDEVPEAFVYSDCNVPFGYRLADNGSEGYKKIYWVPYTHMPLSYMPDYNLNLGDSGTSGWSPEDTIPLYSSWPIYGAAGDIEGMSKVIFYYGDETYPKKFTYSIDPESQELTGNMDFPYKYSGYVNIEVPEEYRDPFNSNKTQAKKNKLYTRWAPAITRVEDGTLGVLWNAARENYPDGKVPVSVYADSQVLSSPLNPNKQNIICYVEKDEDDNYFMDIPEGFDCGWGNIGLPYDFDMTSMRLETGSDSTTIQSANKLINKVGMGLVNTQGGFVGLPLASLEEREEMVHLLNPNTAELPKPQSGYYEWTIPTNYNNDGKVSIRHVDPSPITVLALYPAGVASGD